MDKRTLNRLATQAYNLGRERWAVAPARARVAELTDLVKGTQAERVVRSQLSAGFAHGLGSRNK